MTLDDVRDYERQMHEKTNIKVVNCHEQQEHSTTNPSSLDDIEIHDKASVCVFFIVSLLHYSSSYLIFEPKVSVNDVFTDSYNCTHSVHPLILSNTESKYAYLNCCLSKGYINSSLPEYPKGLINYLRKVRKHKWTLENAFVADRKYYLVLVFWVFYCDECFSGVPVDFIMALSS